MADAAWDETRIRLRDAVLAAVKTQLEAGRSGKVIARHLDRILKLLRSTELQASLPEEYRWTAEDLEDFMEPEIARFRDLTANDRPPSRLLDLANTRRWLTSYIAKFRMEHPAAPAKEWRGLLEPVWREALEQTVPLEEATLDEVRDARTDKAAAEKLLCAGTYPIFRKGTPTDDDLGRMLDRVKFNGAK